jgi:hypothetical protein
MFVHNIEAVHHLLEALPAIAGELLAGLVVGAVVRGAVKLIAGLSMKATS